MLTEESVSYYLLYEINSPDNKYHISIIEENRMLGTLQIRCASLDLKLIIAAVYKKQQDAVIRVIL